MQYTDDEWNESDYNYLLDVIEIIPKPLHQMVTKVNVD